MAQGLFNLKQVNQAVQQGAWTTGLKTTAVDYLVVAGGGNGGDLVGGGVGAAGGGAGGVLTGSTPVVSGSAITVTVGAGLGRFGEGTGGSSVFGSISTTGGGSGARANNNAGRAGGSGGGGSGPSVYTNGYQGIFNQGNRGGNSPADAAAGGGGGAGSRGINGLNTCGGNGGVGVASDISGTRTTYAGGGGGGGANNGIGGQGGGGNAGVAGTANTGGGGGGAPSNNEGYAGGSGIVIVSYPDVYAAATATTGSPTVSTSGSGSISFNGSSQWVTYASNAAWTLGSTFTIEAWVYATSLTSGSRRICQSDAGFDFSVSNTGNVLFNAATTTTTITTNTWYHIAFVCSGGTSTLYINGTASGFTGTNTGVNVSGTSTLTVGTYQTNSGFAWQGYISNFRIVKNSAVYTGNFTPSTIPLTAITNTQLLLTANSGGFLADGSTNGFATTSITSASPTWNSASPFSVTGYKNRVYTWTSSGSITF
jgi:hypothetical protein